MVVNIRITARARRALAVSAALLVVAGSMATPANAAGSKPAGASSRAAASSAVAAKVAAQRDAALKAAVPPELATKLQYNLTRLAKAKPDECFNGIGQPYPAGPPCAEGKAKVDQAYVWGLTQVGQTIWFGTGANVNCLVSGATLDYVVPVANDNYTCEYGEAQTVKTDPTIPTYLGDMRPPQVWTYDKKTRKSVNLSSEITANGAADTALLAHTVGLRAAGTLGGVVLFGGPTSDDTMNMFAFDASSKKYLGSINFPDFGNIRTFLVAEDALYLGVGVGRNGSLGGAVLRWTGSLADPFNFETVASLPVQAADLTLYGDQIAATSWPAAQPTSVAMLAGLWVSPKLSDGDPGLNPEDSAGWKQIWNARMYEPDKVVSATYGGGGIASYGGYVYWGTMHVPMKSSMASANKYPPVDEAAAKEQDVNTQRAVSIWRAKDLGLPTQKIELLYGETSLPAWDPVTSTWSQVSTNFTPLYGKSGFGNLFNNYTWRMTVVDDKLFIGTMDWSYLVKDLIHDSKTAPVNAAAQAALSDPSSWGQPLIKPSQFGGDLWMFSDTTSKATAINTRGEGNYLNYGIRNMIPNGAGGLYLGMANPMNLRTDPKDRYPEGGWELIQLSKRTPKTK
jgi:hypothetical protein